MWRIGILLCLLIVPFSEGKDRQEVCTLRMMCDKIDEVKSEVDAVREEQEQQKLMLENQANILENQSDILKQQSQILGEMALSRNKSYPSSCADVSREIKLLIRLPEYSEDPFEVACDQRSHGGGWTIILRRHDGRQDFYRGWEDYKRGFGDLTSEFFLGLDKIHAMTSDQIQELIVLLEDHEGVKAFEMYDEFRVGPETNNYTLESLGFAYGPAGDSLRYQLGMMFSTKDRNNDKRKDGQECAKMSTAAWWYNECRESNLCGTYGNNEFGKGVAWKAFRGLDYSLKRAVMMIRPRTAALNGS
ncbi:microfibril-associated glycoprotein 4-like [Drosophila kikkawai]|uniref:Microfibril-associated glycoprotein 4-like n=1 Tax=Drosophila kikkawai TaxID=30033 RepID=A0A6P4JT95_DROKI|nr:microfibril-associated glycoprotein 4-like [Drosophila kikkawai]